MPVFFADNNEMKNETSNSFLQNNKGIGPSKAFNDKFEFPWVCRQVETHLVFGFFSKYFDFGWVIIVAGAAILAFNFLTFNGNAFQLIDKLSVGAMSFVGGIIFIKKMTRFNQAMAGWFCFKIPLAFAAFMCMTLATLISLNESRPDALANFLIGLIWLPFLEFIPRITPFQKWVTLARFLFSIPVVYMGVHSGCWTWS